MEQNKTKTDPNPTTNPNPSHVTRLPVTGTFLYSVEKISATACIESITYISVDALQLFSISHEWLEIDGNIGGETKETEPNVCIFCLFLCLNTVIWSSKVADDQGSRSVTWP